MNITSVLKKYQLPAALALLTLHAMAMNGFYFIHPYNTIGTYYATFLSKMDPSFFTNSIFVQAVNRNNLRISIFYDIIPFFLRSIDFETFAIIQGGISIFFILAGIYSLTYHFFKNYYSALIAPVLYTVKLNEWTVGSPSPYINFFHHGLPYAYPLAVWSLVFFFRGRYILSLWLAGIAWNFHPMTILFLLIAYAVYFVFNAKEFPARTILLCLGSFIITALPGLVKACMFTSEAQGGSPLWLKSIQWTGWYTCFPAAWPKIWILRAGLFFALTIICVSRIMDKALKQKIYTFFFAVACMCFIGTVFVEAYSVPIIIRLSLWRSTFIYLILALPCIAQTVTLLLSQDSIKKFFAVIFIIFLTGYVEHLSVYYFIFFLVILCSALWTTQKPQPAFSVSEKITSFFCLMFFIMIAHQMSAGKLDPLFVVIYMLTYLFCIATTFLKNKLSGMYLPLLLSLVFLITFDAGVLYYKGGIPVYYHGTFKGHTDPWADVQIAARLHSSRDDLFIVPPYLNDFGNYSQRATLSDWAEGSNGIYLDNQFVEQWFERMQALGWTECAEARKGYDALTTEDIINVAKKYSAKFVVTEKPKQFDLFRVYENGHYLLYRIN